jgi:hypothetical protein
MQSLGLIVLKKFSKSFSPPHPQFLGCSPLPPSKILPLMTLQFVCAKGEKSKKEK